MRQQDAIHHLDDYIDGLLQPEARAALEALLATSESLRQELQGLRELRAAVAELPRSLEPASDLWPGIVERIKDRKLVRGRFDAPRDRDPHARARAPWAGTWRQWGLLAAAAMLLVTVSSGITAYLVRDPGAPTPLPSPAGGSTEANFTTVAWDEFRAAEVQYQQVTDTLLNAMLERRDELDPETVRIVEDNLRLIDEAIQEARVALERDPANGRLATKLTDIYRQRVDFLLQMNRL